MPYFCLREGRARPERQSQAACAAARVLVLGVAYKADIDDMRESPALKLIELLRGRGLRRRLPRPARAASCASSACARCRSTTSIAAAADCVVDRDRPLARRLRPRGRAGARSSSTSATRPAPPAAGERQGRTSCDRVRVGVVGLGYWGPNLARNIARRRPTSPGAATSPRRTARATRRSTRSARFTDRPRRPADRPRRSTRSSSPRRVPTHHPLGLQRARGRQARVHREAARGLRRPTPRELVGGRRARPTGG